MTRAPAAASARAVARPMPRDAPVTSAVLLMRSVMAVVQFGCEEVDGGSLQDLRGGLAAIDADDLAGDERRLAGGGEHNGVGDLFRPARAFERHAGDKAGFPVGIAGEAIQHRGLDWAGRDRIDTDPERGSFERGRLGQPFDRVLAGSVERYASRAAMAHGR